MGAYESGACGLPSEEFLRGDLDGSGNLALEDAIIGLQYLFATPQARVTCVKAMDFDDDGRLGLQDIIALLQRTFADGGNPSPPYPACGIDPTVMPCRVTPARRSARGERGRSRILRELPKPL